MKTTTLKLCTGVLALACSSQSHSALLATDILNQFNLVVLGDSSSTSEVEGRSYIGGNLSGGSYSTVVGIPASAYSGLTVNGSVSNNINVNTLGMTVVQSTSNSTVNNGPVVIGQNATNSNFNGSGGSYVYGTKSGVNQNSGAMSLVDADAALATAQSTDFSSVMNTASTSLSQLTGNSSVTISGNKAIFTATIDANGLSVFDITSLDTTIFGLSEFEFVNFGLADTVVINTDIATANIAANFLGGSALTIAENTVWNFYEATALDFTTQFGGSVLATGASLLNRSPIEGSVIVGSLDQQGEIHLQPFGGDISTVPVPAAVWLFGSGLIGLVGVARRRA